jgi:hypothetical protein
VLRPLNDDFPEMHAETGQVWIREHAQAPGVVDFVLLDERDGRWVWRHDDNVVLGVADSTWRSANSVRFARAETVLAHKARWVQPKDDADFVAARPPLDPQGRVWLREAVERMYPAHPWLPAMRDDLDG